MKLKRKIIEKVSNEDIDKLSNYSLWIYKVPNEHETDEVPAKRRPIIIIDNFYDESQSLDDIYPLFVTGTHEVEKYKNEEGALVVQKHEFLHKPTVFRFKKLMDGSLDKFNISLQDILDKGTYIGKITGSLRKDIQKMVVNYLGLKLNSEESEELKEQITSNNINKFIVESKQDTENFRKWVENKTQNITKGMTDDDKESYINAFVKFFDEHKQSLKSPLNDYYYWIKKDNWDEFFRFVTNLNDKDFTKRREKTGARLVYSDNDWKVYEITTYEASAKYGKGTKWCITGAKEWASGEEEGRKYFDNYFSRGIRFYFFINKDGEKYALSVNSKGNEVEIFNSGDISIAGIPNAPEIKELEKYNYRLENVSDNDKILHAISIGNIPFNLYARAVVDVFYNHLGFDIDISDNKNDFLSALDDFIPDGYLEWCATDSGALSTEEYENITGEEWTDHWGGDVPPYGMYDELLRYNTKKEMLSDNYWDKYKYFIIYHDEYDYEAWLQYFKNITTLNMNLAENFYNYCGDISEYVYELENDFKSVTDNSALFALVALKIINSEDSDCKNWVNSILNKEVVSEEYNEEQVQKEAIEKHDTLNPKLFEDNKLKEEIADKLRQIANTFIDEVKEDELDIKLKDIVLMGSNANYNYTDNSDIDLHLIVDSTNLDCDKLYAKVYDLERRRFNKDYDITIKDIPVEIYVEMDEPKGVSGGMYSLDNGWIKEPEQKNIPEINQEEFNALFKEWEDKYLDLMASKEYPLDESLLKSLKEDVISNIPTSDDFDESTHSYTITTNEELLDFFKQHESWEQFKVVYDPVQNIYIVGDPWDKIHLNLLYDARDNGWYDFTTIDSPKGQEILRRCTYFYVNFDGNPSENYSYNMLKQYKDMPLYIFGEFKEDMEKLPFLSLLK